MIELEIRMLNADVLPVQRVPPLLNAVESHQTQEAADALAAQVAVYSDHPDVLERALRLARMQGDSSAASGAGSQHIWVCPSLDLVVLQSPGLWQDQAENDSGL